MGRTGNNKIRELLIFILIMSVCSVFAGVEIADAQEVTSEVVETSEASTQETPAFAFANNMSDAMRQEADQVKVSLTLTVKRLFSPDPLGFSPETFIRLYHDLVRMPLQLPRLMKWVADQARLLGAVGTVVILLFLGGLIYSLVGQKKVLKKLEATLVPLTQRIPEHLQPWFHLPVKLVSVLIVPLGFWITYWLIKSFTGMEKPWFLLIGNLMIIWAAGGSSLLLIRECFLKDLIPIPSEYGDKIYKVLRVIILYIVFTTILFYCAEAFMLKAEYLALLRVILSLTVVLATLTLIARKQEILSLLPELPYTIYRNFRIVLTRLYTPAMVGTFLTGVLWCFGYRELCRFIWIKTWAVAAVIVLVGIIYHYLNLFIERCRKHKTRYREAADTFYAGVSSALIFLTIIVLVHSVLSLLGVYEPLKRLISFPIFIAGQTPISLWSFFRAFLIIWIFNLVSRIMRGYLDYKVFPVIGVEEGLAYSINTFLAYLLLITGGLFAMHTVGLDLRVLMVFAGAVGIGIGLGLQNLASSVISGFTLIFGQKIRKGDWIQVGDTIGYVKEVALRVTKVITRDNIEFLIPNSELTANTITNFTLTEPLIRVHVPVGVSYDADPRTVQAILLDQASKNKVISRKKPPEVWFSEYGDSSINFVLLIWIDVRRLSAEKVKSDLYFDIFQALSEAGIEIPFPQRDVHIRTRITGAS